MTLEVGDPGDGLTSGSGSPIAQRRGVCEACGTPLATDHSGQYCPVCMLRRALGSASESNLDIPGTTVELESAQYGFEHYKLVLNEDGTPLELGRGAMGVTFKATDINLKRLVALKVVSARYLGNESARERFVSEARAAAGLHHPNIASVFHLGKTGDDYFYAMEFVEGETLDRVLKFRGPLDVDVALEIVNQVAAALSAAYRHNLVHRDIKPGNLMVVFGEANRVTAKVIDFGLAKPLHYQTSERARSEAGIFFGTPHFASPEQCLGKEADNRSDIYSLGVTLWAMLTGHVPFEGMVTEVMQKHVHEPPPVERLEHVPKPVVSLIKSLLEKDPDNRPQTPYELQTLIGTLRETLRVKMPSDSSPNALVKPVQPALLRRKRYLVIAFILVIGLAGGFSYFFYQRPGPIISPKSVAVMPFDSVGSSSQDDYLSDGLTTEVIFQLSKISDLRVISRSSILRYKAAHSSASKQVPPDIRSELEVATVLESSVQRLENRIKITTILYDARTYRQLWAESYDREIKDLFAIQSDVAENIAAALKVRLSADERNDIQRKPTESPTAYDLYLRGIAFYELRHKDDNERAIALFRQAIEQDSKFAPGYVALGNAYIDRYAYYEGEAFWLDSAIDLFREAIRLDPRQARGYSGLAHALNFKGLDAEARVLTKKALELAPNDVEAIRRAIYESAQTSHLDEEYALLRRCHALEPNDPFAPYYLSQICAAVGEPRLMEKWMQSALNLELDAQRHRLLECERLIFRRDFKGAAAGLRDLPLDFRAYKYYVLQLLVGCSLRTGDRDIVVHLANERLQQGPGNWHWDTWALCYLALSSLNTGQEDVSREKAERLLNSIQEALALAGEAPGYWHHYYLAVGNRILGRREEAYRQLVVVFPAILTELPLMNDDPTLGVFWPDSEFQRMVSENEKCYERMRTRIREIDKSL